MVDVNEISEGWATIGHVKAVAALAQAMAADSVAHAYLIVGPRGIGKMTLAHDIARMVNCTENDPPCGQCGQCRRITNKLHADVQTIGLEQVGDNNGRTSTAIGIGQIREAKRDAGLRPYEGRSRVFIIDGVELMTEEASNSLLKVLEEPPDQVIFVLLVTDLESVLATISSRCRILELRPLPASMIADELFGRFEADQELVNEVAQLSGGKLGWAIQMMESPDLLESRSKQLDQVVAISQATLADRFDYANALAGQFARDRESVVQQLRLWLQWWRDALIVREGVSDFVTNLSRTDTLKRIAEVMSSAQIAGVIQRTEETIDLLERNVNPRLALEQLVLAVPSIPTEPVSQEIGT